MLFTLSQEDQMLKDLVARFVKDELMPLEQKVLARDAAGTGPLTITREEHGQAGRAGEGAGPVGARRARRNSADPTCRSPR